MPKIKNWSKASMKQDWVHDQKRHTVKIRDAGGKSGLYQIKLHVSTMDRENRESNKFRHHIGSASTMDKAKKKAVQWMKNHPNSVNIC